MTLYIDDTLESYKVKSLSDSDSSSSKMDGNK